jgi:hypothetical protein
MTLSITAPQLRRGGANYSGNSGLKSRNSEEPPDRKSSEVHGFYSLSRIAIRRTGSREQRGPTGSRVSSCEQMFADSEVILVFTQLVRKTLERTGAQDIASTGEASSDQGKSDKPVRREVA